METKPTIKMLEKRDFGQVINTTFSFIRLTGRSLVRNLLIFSAPFFVIAGIISATNQYDQLTGLTNATDVISSGLISMMFYMLGTIISMIIAGVHISEYHKHQKTEIATEEVIGAIKSNFVRIFLNSIVYYLIMGVGFVLLVIPGIYLAIALSLCSMIMILEPQANISFSLKESMRLIKGNWWLSFGLYLIIGVITYVFAIIFLLPSIISIFLISFNSIKGSEAESYRILHLVFSAVGQLGYSVVLTIPFIMFGIYYYSLREKKDDVSMLQTINNIGNSESARNTNESLS